MHELIHVLQIHQPHIVFLQETHLSKRSVGSLRKFAERVGCIVFAYARSQAAGGVAAGRPQGQGSGAGTCHTPGSKGRHRLIRAIMRQNGA